MCDAMQLADSPPSEAFSAGKTSKIGCEKLIGIFVYGFGTADAW